MNKNTFNFNSVVVIFFIILITVALVKTYVLRQIEETAKQDINNALVTVLNSSRESFQIWVDAKKEDVTSAASSTDLVRIVKELLTLPRSKPILINTPLQSELRAHLSPEMERHHLLGFFIIAPDFTSLSSLRDTNIGTENLMAKQKGLLQRVFKGEPLISYPMKSDVPLPNHHGELQDKLPTMFVAAPVVDENKNIIAVMTFRFDPAKRFTQMLQLARLGKTGETYAFDLEGRLISESRFDKDIRQAGLIKENEESILNVLIRDPGVNLLEGEHTSIAVDERPLTLMASSAILGKAGSNSEGYRDYRGVPVVGAWLWENAYGFGLATEMDKEEAYAGLEQTKELVFISFVITFVSFAFFAAYVIFLGRKSEKDQLQLRQTEEQLHNMSENTSSFLYVKDLEGKYTYVNRQFSKAWGVPIKEILGKSDYDLFPKEAAEAFTLNDKRVIESGKIMEFEEVAKLKGSTHTYIASKFPLLDSSGKPYALCGISTDITTRKQAEEEIQKLSQVVKQSSFALVITDATGTIEYVNPCFTKSTGYTADEVIGKTPSILKSGETSPSEYKRLWETITSGKEWRGVFHNKKKDGTLYWEKAVIAPLRDDNGKVTHFIAVKEDITKQKKMETTLLDHETFIHSIVENILDGLIAASSSGIIQLFNPQAEKIFGYTADEVIGKNITVLMTESDGEKHLLGFENYLKTGIAKIIGTTVEVQGLRKDQTSFPVELSISEMTQREEKWFIATTRDITEHKEAEERMELAQKQIIASQKLAGVGELAAGVSHEVLNPVNIISVHTQMLQKKTKDDPKIQNFCNKVRHEIDRIQKIMSSLLTFSRSGDSELQSGNLRDSIESVLALVEAEYKLDNIKIVRDWCDSLVEISYDPDKIRQVYLNLLHNAKHAMPDGGTITVGCASANNGGKDYHQFTFSDTGTGMSEEVRLKIFEPFFTTKPEGEGTGMGLSVIHGIIEEHGGKIRVESEEGKGTTFTISLPVAN